MCSRLSKFGLCAPRMLGAEGVTLKMVGRPPTTLSLLLPTTTSTTATTTPSLSVSLHNAAMLAECGRVGLADSKWGMSIEGEPPTGIFAVQMDFTLRGDTSSSSSSLDPDVGCVSGLLSPLAVGEKPTKIVKVRTTTTTDADSNTHTVGSGGDGGDVLPAMMVDTTYVHVCAIARKAEPMRAPFLQRLLTLEPHPLVSLPSLPPPTSPKNAATTATTVQFEIQKDHMREGGKGHLAMHMYPIYLDHVLRQHNHHTTTTTSPKRVSIQYVKEIMNWEDTYLDITIHGLEGKGCMEEGSVCTFDIGTVPRDNATSSPSARVVAAKGTIVF